MALYPYSKTTTFLKIRFLLLNANNSQGSVWKIYINYGNSGYFPEVFCDYCPRPNNFALFAKGARPMLLRNLFVKKK